MVYDNLSAQGIQSITTGYYPKTNAGFCQTTTPRFKFCPEDGFKFEEGWNYCPKCGRNRAANVSNLPYSQYYDVLGAIPMAGHTFIGSALQATQHLPLTNLQSIQ